MKLLNKKVRVSYEGPKSAKEIKGILTEVGVDFIGIKKGSHTIYIPINRIFEIKEVVRARHS